MNKVNYQKEMENIIGRLESRPTLFLHSCCAPCSSYCMEYTREYFDVTVFYYNPNISSDEEYRKRLEEEKRLIAAFNKQVETGNFVMNSFSHATKIHIVEGDYQPQDFYNIARGLEQCPEGGSRCFKCYELRLRESFRVAKERVWHYLASTLTISPLKNADKINEIGFALAEEYGVSWLPGDFKKKNGYKRSIELSEQYHLYRQDFCGCKYSKEEEIARKQKHASES